MKRVAIVPASESDWLALRDVDLTSTESAALFMMSPYVTAFELWHAKKSATRTPFKVNDRMLWGNRLQDAIAYGIAQDCGIEIEPFREYMRLPDLRIGSSFDYRIVGAKPGSRFAAVFERLGPGILEIKNVDFVAFRSGWVVEDDFVEAPAHIEIQVQHQQLVSGYGWSVIGAFVAGNRYEINLREADPSVHAGILAAAAKFWSSIERNEPPPPVMPDDAGAVIRSFQYAEPGKFFDARGDAEIATACRKYQRLGLIEKKAKERREVLKAELLSRIGSAEKVATDVGTISAGLTGPAEIPAYTRAGFRQFRFTPAKKKAAA